ncbi:VWA domain-containing protein [Paenibacillus doosanensis]|uniref:Cobalamin biosynthesis protein CobT VWA domain protein n=1 Tax=Paenibacillus konkukensis TaxID=2020716 RepID=A0ABY4RGX6_9BACL|nr:MULTISPECIES: VWA domain-containing protein [Paenibacillus]MCS7461101.1 VWA domain-containing protein [Paenibacillus doosanensis]UQZ81597.1 Cobalamin biosynthesis protein CobT VWA domain protein [Paenibacillus konkukensis]
MRFVENEVDAFLHMQLLDLAKALSGLEELRLEFSYHSFYDDREKMIAVSQFWSYYPEETKLAGMKTDVYLRAAGSAWFTDSRAVAGYLDWSEGHLLSRLARQLLALCEEIRLTAICIRLRPGTASGFKLRSQILAKHYAAKSDGHFGRKELSDALLCAAAALLHGQAAESLLLTAQGSPQLLEPLNRWLRAVSSLRSTVEAAQLCQSVVERWMELGSMESDCRVGYYSLLRHNGTVQPLSWDYIGELKRKKKLKSGETLPLEKREEPQQKGEKLPNWHRETKKQEQTLLRFDIEQGSGTDLLSDHVREADSDDQALGIAQGASRAANRNEPELPSLEPLDRIEGGPAGGAEPYGRLNRKARPVYRQAEAPDSRALLDYAEMKRQVEPIASKLKKTIRMTMEQKRSAPRGERLSGRLGRKLVRSAWEPLPRLFYKRSQPAAEIDAVFSLLVDCSASMYDKMERAHLGIALFHESLTQLCIPHEVIGFWEDADEVTEEAAPNVFRIVTDFAGSLTDPSAGAKLLQLQAEQDNRDGYAIRIASERLLPRPEKQKVLLVFSDGEPSASDYHEEGIVDTCEAVLQARRRGVEVISVFIGSGFIKDTERETMRNIYGRHSVLVPDVSELAGQLAPILRRLLLR